MFGSFGRHLRSLPIQTKLLVVTIPVDSYRWIILGRDDPNDFLQNPDTLVAYDFCNVHLS
jgi:hypothetical protein